MAISVIRATSETPNVNNTDDVRAFRYGFGNNDGYIKGYLNEFDINATLAPAEYSIKSGEAVIQGWQIRSDTEYELPIISTTTATYSYATALVLTIGASSLSAEIVTTHQISTSSYPAIADNDDIGGNGKTGTIRILLYNYRSSNGSITEYTKKITAIPYSKDVAAALETRIDTTDANVSELLRTTIGTISSSNNWTLWSDTSDIRKSGKVVTAAVELRIDTAISLSSSTIYPCTLQWKPPHFLTFISLLSNSNTGNRTLVVGNLSSGDGSIMLYPNVQTSTGYTYDRINFQITYLSEE